MCCGLGKPDKQEACNSQAEERHDAKNEGEKNID